MDRWGSKISVAVIGAGFGGLCMAAALKSSGFENFRIFEKADEVGGIWRDNRYPGCGCDVPSHLYSFSFEKCRDAAVRYPGHRDTLRYLVDVSEKYGLRGHLSADAEVISATYDDDSGRWTVVDLRGGEYQADVVVSAVGQLHRLRLPDIAGLADFAGPAFHTAQWDREFDPAGLDVAVIGTGSSAAQLLPHIASQAKRVEVYQRTPSWVVPKPDAEFGAATRWAFKRLPALQSVYRASVYLAADTVLSPVITRGWSFHPAKRIAQWHLRRQVADSELRARLTPALSDRLQAGRHRQLVLSRIVPAQRPTRDGRHRAHRP